MFSLVFNDTYLKGHLSNTASKNPVLFEICILTLFKRPHLYPVNSKSHDLVSCFHKKLCHETNQ